MKVNAAVDNDFITIKPEHIELKRKVEKAIQWLDMDKLQEVLNYIEFLEFKDNKTYDSSIEETKHKEVFYPEQQE